MEKFLLPLPAKRYFTIGEVSELCGVKPHVLRYWEQEFKQLRPIKRRGNRRYYQNHEVLMIRRIRELLYEQGFTISGARNKLQELVEAGPDRQLNGEAIFQGMDRPEGNALSLDHYSNSGIFKSALSVGVEWPTTTVAQQRLQLVRCELLEIRDLLGPAC